MSLTRRGTLQVALAACTWGTWSLFFRPAERLGQVSPALQAFVVFAVSAVGLLPAALRHRPAAPRPARAWLLLLVFGLTDAGNVICFFEAMQRTSLAVAVLTHYLAPLLVAVAAPLALGERSRSGTHLSLGLSLAGLVLLLEPWRPEAAGAVDGALFGTASAVFYAANVLLAKGLQRHFTASETIAYHMIPSALVVALFVPAGGFFPGVPALSLLVLGSLTAGLGASLLFYRGLREIPAERASVLTLLEPLTAVIVGVLVWGESLGPLAVAGAALLLAGAYRVVVSRADPAAP